MTAKTTPLTGDAVRVWGRSSAQEIGHGWGRQAGAIMAAVLASAGIVLTAPGVASAQTVPDSGKSILLLDTTWEGYVQFPDTSGGWSWSEKLTADALCTGWFASSEGHIVTAGHCVDPGEGRTALLEKFLAANKATNLLQDAVSNWKVEGQQQGTPPDRTVQAVQPSGVSGAVIKDPLTVQVLDSQPFLNGDLALLKANGLAEATPALTVAAQQVEVGQQVTAIGFPGSVADVSDARRLQPSFKTGTVSSRQISPEGVAGTEINADISPGMSGGPTIDDSGEVLGVNSFTVNGESRDFNFITDAQALRSFLKQHDVPLASTTSGSSGDARTGGPASKARPTVAMKPAETNAGLPLWIFVAGGLGVLLVAATVVTLSRRRRPAGPAAFPPPPFPGMQPPAPAGPQGGSAVGPCSHDMNAPGASFCQNCGSPLFPAAADHQR